MCCKYVNYDIILMAIEGRVVQKEKTPELILNKYNALLALSLTDNFSIQNSTRRDKCDSITW